MGLVHVYKSSIIGQYKAEYDAAFRTLWPVDVWSATLLAKQVLDKQKSKQLSLMEVVGQFLLTSYDSSTHCWTDGFFPGEYRGLGYFVIISSMGLEYYR